MTIGELIRLLGKKDKDLKVFFTEHSFVNKDELVKITSVTIHETENKENKMPFTVQNPDDFLNNLKNKIKEKEIPWISDKDSKIIKDFLKSNYLFEAVKHLKTCMHIDYETAREIIDKYKKEI